MSSFHIQYGQRRVVRSQISATKAMLGIQVILKAALSHPLSLSLFIESEAAAAAETAFRCPAGAD